MDTMTTFLLLSSIFAAVLSRHINAKDTTRLPSQAKNYVLNPNFAFVDNSTGFPTNWTGDHNIYQVDHLKALPPATSSLRYNNSDQHLYTLFTQKILGAELQRQYMVSVDVYTVGLITPNNTGGSATVCVQWDDMNGTWAGGTFPSGPLGTTTSWTHVSGSFRMPLNVDPASLTVSVYVRPTDRGNPTPTGIAYFDNVSLVSFPPQRLQTALLSPVYRGRVTKDDVDPIAVKAQIELEDTSIIVIVASIVKKNSSDSILNSRENSDPIVSISTDPIEIQAFTPTAINLTFQDFDKLSLAPGAYEIIVECDELHPPTHQRSVLQTQILNLTRVDDTDPQPKVYIDNIKRTVVDGKPWFPMGVYFSTGLMSNTSQALVNVSKSPFNFVMPYGEATMQQLNMAHSLGVKVAFSLKDLFYGSKYAPKEINSSAAEETIFKERVAEFKSHPSVIAWYINDELPATTYYRQLLAHQNWIVEGDNDHPSWQVLCEDGEFDEYMGTFDIIGSDPYPVGEADRNISLVHQEANSTVFLTDNARPVWEVIQAMNWENYHHGAPCPLCHTPTYNETRSMVWQAIAAGANGIIFYSYSDIMKDPDVNFDTEWGRLKSVATEVLSFAPLLLSDSGIVTSPRISMNGSLVSWILSRAHWRDDGEDYILFIVNDGSGSGVLHFDFTNSNSNAWSCRPSTGLIATFIMGPYGGGSDNPNPIPPISAPNCLFSLPVPIMSVSALLIKGLVK